MERTQWFDRSSGLENKPRMMHHDRWSWCQNVRFPFLMSLVSPKKGEVFCDGHATWLRKKNMCFKSHSWNDWVYLETARFFRIPTFERLPNMNNGAIARYVINSIDCHLWVLIKIIPDFETIFFGFCSRGVPTRLCNKLNSSNSSLPEEWRTCIWRLINLFSQTNHCELIKMI